MRILNAYSGIGGNRKLWGDSHEIVAVELCPKTAEVYKDHYPNDEVVIGDAHQYILDHYKEFDFIWSSPPCPTHSRLNYTRNGRGDTPMQYPNMMLYQEIVFLTHWFDGLFSIENVIPYYKPLIPGQELDRHLFWANFKIPKVGNLRREEFTHELGKISDYERYLGYDLSSYRLPNKLKNLRNCVNPQTGKHILDYAIKVHEGRKAKQQILF